MRTVAWRWGPRLAPPVVFAGLLLAVPAVFTRVPFYTMAIGVWMVLLSLGALGLVPLTGYARQISIGQAAFWATGAYASAIIAGRDHHNALLAMIVGMVISGLAAWVLGLFVFRVQGHYLALATLAGGLAVAYAAGQWKLTGANTGITDVRPLAPFGSRLFGDLPMFYLTAGILFAAVLAVRYLLASPLGKMLTAAGDSPVATAAMGVDLARLRRWAFVAAAVLASLAGSLYAHWTGFIDPTTAGLTTSLELLIVATVGGLRTVWGAPAGAFCVVTLSQATKNYAPKLLPHAGGNYEIIAYGATLVAVLLFAPTGIAGSMSGWGRRVREVLR